MIGYKTEDGSIFWGDNASGVVLRMRYNEFGISHVSNAAYIKAVSGRLRDTFNVTGMARMNEEEFLAKLVELGLLKKLEDEAVCPRAMTICNSRRPDCDIFCWLKKMENQK
jgi:hypothetical protein